MRIRATTWIWASRPFPENLTVFTERFFLKKQTGYSSNQIWHLPLATAFAKKSE